MECRGTEHTAHTKHTKYTRRNKHKATGKWIVELCWNDNEDSMAAVVVDPKGNEWARYSSQGGGPYVARAYADTFNMNKDLADEFRTCPYCKDGCSWCDEEGLNPLEELDEDLDEELHDKLWRKQCQINGLTYVLSQVQYGKILGPLHRTEDQWINLGLVTTGYIELAREREMRGCR